MSDMYIATISYNFDGGSVVRKCDTYEEAVKVLHELLQEEIKTIVTESNYTPSVLEWSEDDIVLVYAEGYTTETTDKNYATEDCGFYRIFEVNAKEKNETKSRYTSEMEIKPGQVVSFDAYDEGSYSILVHEANGTKVKGVIVDFIACYSEACYPSSSIPVVEIEEIDLSDTERIAQDSICVSEPTAEEKYYECNAENAQEEFLKKMVPLSESGKQTYQELVIRIEKTDIEHPWVKKGTYCQMDITNICGFNKDGEFKNPYVVEKTMNANSVEQMEEGYNYYATLEGMVVPETSIKFQITSVADDGKIKEICSVSVPYSVVKEKGLDIFPIELESNYEEKVQNVLAFLSLHEDRNKMEETK